MISSWLPGKRKAWTHVAEVARPVFCAFGTNAELYLDLEVFLADDLGGTGLVDLLGFAVH